MQRLVSSFPAHAQGGGLVLLRVCVALSFLVPSVARAGPPGATLLCVAASVIAVGLGLGAWTPACSVLALVCHVAWVYMGGFGIPLLQAVNIMQAAALFLLGPGAYSIDGYRFGRRVVVIPKV